MYVRICLECAGFVIYHAKKAVAEFVCHFSLSRARDLNEKVDQGYFFSPHFSFLSLDFFCPFG